MWSTLAKFVNAATTVYCSGLLEEAGSLAAVLWRLFLPLPSSFSGRRKSFPLERLKVKNLSQNSLRAEAAFLFSSPLIRIDFNYNFHLVAMKENCHLVSEGFLVA